MPLRPTPAHVTLLVACGLLGLAGLAVPLLWWEFSAQLAAYVGLVVLLAILVATLILRRWTQDQLDWFEPGVFLGIAYLLAFALGGLRFFLDPSLLHPSLREDPTWLIRALFFVILGVGAFWVGYYGRLGLLLQQITSRWGREVRGAQASIRPAVVVALYLVGLGVRLYMLHMGWYGFLMQRESYFSSLPLTQVLAMLEQFCVYALVLALLDHFSHPQHLPRRLLAVSLLGSEIIWGFFSGFKGLTLWPLILYLMVYTYKRRRLPVRYLLVVALGLVLLYPLNSVYRWLVSSRAVQIQHPSDMVSSVPVIMSEVFLQFADPRTYLESGYAATLNRTTLIQNYAILLKYLDTTGAYHYGKDFLLLPALVFVPRFLWPTKPLADKGYWFAVNVMGQSPRVYSSTAITYLGDLHLQFGLPSLLLGMFLTGVVFRWLYERYARPASSYSLFFYILLFRILVQQESDVLFKLAGLVKVFIVLFALSLLAFRVPRPVFRFRPLLEPGAASPPTAAAT